VKLVALLRDTGSFMEYLNGLLDWLDFHSIERCVTEYTKMFTLPMGDEAVGDLNAYLNEKYSIDLTKIKESCNDGYNFALQVLNLYVGSTYLDNEDEESKSRILELKLTAKGSGILNTNEDIVCNLLKQGLPGIVMRYLQFLSLEKGDPESKDMQLSTIYETQETVNNYLGFVSQVTQLYAGKLLLQHRGTEPIVTSDGLEDAEVASLNESRVMFLESLGKLQAIVIDRIKSAEPLSLVEEVFLKQHFGNKDIAIKTLTKDLIGIEGGAGLFSTQHANIAEASSAADATR
jgi:hypothetical protein